jgi:hypothetical protein
VIERDPDKRPVQPIGAPSEAADLPYQIALSPTDGSSSRILARAASMQLARAIFNAAKNEHDGQRILLTREGRLMADSASGD